jgi:hypothetical protein
LSGSGGTFIDALLVEGFFQTNLARELGVFRLATQKVVAVGEDGSRSCRSGAVAGWGFVVQWWTDPGCPDGRGV